MYENKTLIDRVKTFDIYQKLPKGYLQPTLIGACLTVFTVIISIYLFIFEFSRYFSETIKSEMQVDMSKGSDKLRINIDLTLNKLPCTWLNLDIYDKIQSHALKIDGKITKNKLTSKGNFLQKDIPLIKRADTGNNEDLIYDALQKEINEGQGCRLIGSFNVERVPGHFKINFDQYGDLVDRYIKENPAKKYKVDLSHKVNRLTFGNENDFSEISNSFKKGEVSNPLDGVSKIDNEKNNIFEYYLNIVRTKYSKGDWDKNEIDSNQFTVNSNIVSSQRIFPSVFFTLDISPILVKYSKIKPSMFTGFINFCAIFGGMFTIAGILDSLILKLLKKAEGKKE